MFPLCNADTQSFQRGGGHPAPEEAPEGPGSPAPEGPGSPAPEGPGRGSPAPVVMRRARGGRGRGGRGRGGRGDANVCILSLCSDFSVSLSTNFNGVLLT